MNIQCENCHGPQNSDAHGQTAARVSLSSDVCGSCHGEPARHGRFQQWQLSGHANFETAISEGTNASCAKCHSAQGFMQWGDKGYASTATINVTWTADEVQPQTCVVCHDPHAEGTTSSAGTNAQMRVQNNTPVLDAGFAATNVGKAAECITCHNSRRGLKDDQHFTASSAAQAPHEGPQADIVLGQNLFFAKVGTKGYHGMLADSCVTCHMRDSAAPTSISMAGQTNHTFYADPGICSQCHSEITAAQIQGQVAAKMATLKANIEGALKASMQAQIRAGNTVDFGSGIIAKNAADIGALSFVSSHGSQGINATIAGKSTGDLALTGINVVRPGGSKAAIATVYDPAIAKAGWNYFQITNDKSVGVHNPAFVNSALDVANYATAAVVTQLNTTATSAPGGVSPASIGGGLGNGAGAVSCSTPYVYWAEIASHAPGASGSQWRTDLVTRNLGTANANVKFFLHQADGTSLNGTGAINGGAQKAFEDVVATLGGGNNIGSLEICSDQPLLVNGRIYNAATSGTFGQNLDGAVADVGYATGQTINLIGLRQKSGKYRTNLSVTNGGTSAAQVSISLFDTTGTSIKTYTLSIPAGQVVQDGEPFNVRANAPDLDWGFATVTILSGSNIHTSASVVDAVTNDPTTISPKM
jgi:ssDNA-binding Zn-finger/Zn-ribbon topoisomerase 1